MREFKSSKKIQLRFYAGRWWIIWPARMQYGLTGRRFDTCREYQTALDTVRVALILYQWQYD